MASRKVIVVMSIFVCSYVQSSYEEIKKLLPLVPEMEQSPEERRDEKEIIQELIDRPHFVAALKGDRERFNAIVKDKKIVISEEKFSDDSNLLHFAARGATSALIKPLVDAGIPINEQNLKGHVPLFLAFETKNTENVRTLLDSGADPLHSLELYKLENHARQRFVWFNEVEREVLDVRTRLRQTNALYWGAYFKFNDALKMLYKRNLSINERSTHSEPILVEPLLQNDVRTLYQLLHYGAIGTHSILTVEGINQIYYNGWQINFKENKNPGACAIPLLRPFVLYGIFAVDDTWSHRYNPLDFACPAVFFQRDQSKDEVALCDNAPVHHVDDLGALPLHYAVGQGNVAMVKQLIEKGSNVYKRTIYGPRALDLVRVILKRDTYQPNTKKEDYLALKELLTKAELVKEAALLRSKQKHDKKYTYVQVSPLSQEIVKHIQSYVEGY